jgi:DNA (cytosine-5)-methyltransferase 1
MAGFPCQPWSIAGVSKKNSLGRPTGFADQTQGTLFFDIVRMLDAKRPAAFLLENVKNLVSHDRGNTFRVIMHVLTEELGYHVHWKVIDGKCWTPQRRERIYIVGFDEDLPFSWSDLEVPESGGVFADVMETDVPEKYTLSDKLWTYLQGYAEKHRAKGNGFGYGTVGPDDTTRTISARYYKDGSECLVLQDGRNPRRLTPRECARLQGFPDSFEIPVSDTQAYRQFGNSVCVPAVAAVARLVREALWTTDHSGTTST